MATISKAINRMKDDIICQGDIFKNVKYNYIESENDDYVDVVEMIFPYAIIVSQACDVIAMGEFQKNRFGKATKYMPSILLCPIYDEKMLKDNTHLTNLSESLSLTFDTEKLYQKDDLSVAKRDWHYRFHPLTISLNNNIVMSSTLIDYKHYFTVPASYLESHIDDRLFKLDDLYAEQISLKFATYLSRVAIP